MAIELTKKKVFEYWKNELIKDKNVYNQPNDPEMSATMMAEDAQAYYKIDSPNGDTPLEEQIFYWAQEYTGQLEKL